MKKLPENYLLSLAAFLIFVSIDIAISQEDEDVVRISDINLEGAEAVPKKEIKENIATEFPSIKPWVKDPEFDEEILRADMVRIERLYSNYGYYDANAEYKLKFNEDRSRVEIMINIKEGKPIILTELNINLQGELSEKVRKRILNSVPLKVDEVFSPIKYQRTKGVVSDNLSNNGYPKAKVKGEALVNREEKWAKATFTIRLGPLYRFGSIGVEGNEEVETYVIRREATYKEGEIYSTTKLNQTRARIFRLDLFSSIVIDVNFNEGEKLVNTIIRVRERKFNTIKVGAGFGTEDLLRGQIIWTQRNLFGGGRRLDTSGKFSFITQRLETVFTQPYIVGGGSEFTTSFSLRRDDLPGFTSENILGAVGVRKEFTSELSAFGSFNVLLSKLSNVSEPPDIDETRECRDCFLTFFNTGLEWNTTDNILNPTEGIVTIVGLESSFKTLGSDVNYLLGAIDLRGYKKILGVVLAKRFSIGVIQPFGGTDTFEIPILKRFFAGGSTSHRGFPFQKLGPVDDDEDPLGGNSLLLGSLEARFPIYKDFGGVVFFDYGNVYSEEFDYKLDEIKYAVGVGLRYNTLIGPLRVDFGYALNPEPEFSRYQYFLSVGQAF